MSSSTAYASRRPNPMPRIYRWRSNLILVPTIGVVTGIMGSLALFVSLFERSGRVQHRIAQLWARLCIRISLWPSGSTLTIRGAENLGKYPVAVYAANHTSYMDTPVVFAALPFQFRILAKKELWPIAFIGWYLNRSGQIPIDTVTARGTLTSLGAGARALTAGMALFVFPEGGRTEDGTLQPFMSGAAFLAIRAQVPIVPIALTGVYNLLPMHTHWFYPGELVLTVGEPIETKDMNTRQTEELNVRLRSTVEAMLAERAPAEASTHAS
jgi:1-acyl-sn-glycerol-3-phosphate acyltransferase